VIENSIQTKVVNKREIIIIKWELREDLALGKV
jgi:hypothetical protein